MERATKGSKAGLVLALNGICGTLGAMAHKGLLTDTTRVHKRIGAGPRSEEMAFFLVLCCDNEPRWVDEAKNWNGK